MTPKPKTFEEVKPTEHEIIYTFSSMEHLYINSIKHQQILIDALTKARDALEDLEWASFIGDTDVSCCPSCEATWRSGKGHHLNCSLKKDLDFIRETLSLEPDLVQTNDNALKPQTSSPLLAEQEEKE